MNSSSKVPPRFVPTLTEVVPIEAQSTEEELVQSHVAEHAMDDVEQGSHQLADSQSNVAESAPLASFHSPWLADGLYVRRKPATIPRELPPLPESLPPQQPFSDKSVAQEPVEGPAQKTEFEAIAGVGVVEVDLQDEVLPEAPVLIQVQAEEIHAEQINPEPLLADASPSSEPISGHLGSDAKSLQMMEDAVVHRLMQRVDLVLEQRLKDVIARVVQEQANSMVLRLREEIESAVRESVQSAVASECVRELKPGADNPVVG